MPRAATGSVLSSNAELVLGPDVVLTGSVTADTLVLHDRAIVSGGARYNALQNAGTIQGTQNTPLPLPLAMTLPTLPSIAIGTQNITLSSSQQLSLSAGKYGTVTLSNGNGGIPTKLTLSGGLYQLKSLTLQNDARVECTAPCEIRVQQRTSIGQRSFIGPKSGVAGLGPGNVQLIVGGQNVTSGPWGSPPAFLVDNDADLSAYVFAPNGTTRLGHRVDFLGKIVTKDCLVGFDNDAEGLQLPLISAHPQDLTVREFETATFSVSVSAGTGLSYRWQRNGVDIPGPAGAAASYTIASAAVSDDGAVFRVRITNAAGHVTSNPATLHVIPCEDDDTTCDNFDDDCDGLIDEDFGPRCNQEGGTAILFCGGGNVFAAPCIDGNLCNGTEVCFDAVCVPGTPLDTDDGNPCTVDSCNPASGVAHEPLPAGTDCGDGNDCNGFDTCSADAVCVHSDRVVSQDPCLVDVCDPATGWALVPAEAGTPCADGDPLTEPDVCDGNGECKPLAVINPPLRGERPGELKSFFFQTLPPGADVVMGAEGNVKPPDNWRVESTFRSHGFNPIPGTADEGAYERVAVPEPGTESVDFDFGMQLRIVLDGIGHSGDDCIFGSLDVRSQATVDGEALPTVKVFDLTPCALDPNCTAPIEANLGTAFLAATSGSVTIDLRVVEVDNSFTCGSDEVDIDFAPLVLSYGPSGATSTTQCGSGSQITNFCWHVEVEPGLPAPTPADTRLCFDWTTNLVDEGQGEDITGKPTTHPLEQRYPARFAEYQLELEGVLGTRRIGAHYDDVGMLLPCLDAAGAVVECSAARTAGTLDEDGCVSSSLLPAYLFTHPPVPGGLSLRARVRTRVSRTDLPSGPGYNVRYADVSSDPADDDTFQVLEYRFESGPLANYSGWNVLSEPPFGSIAFPPAVEWRLASNALTPATNTAAVLGTLLTHEDSGHPGDMLEVRVGDGAVFPEFGGVCLSEGDCALGEVCAQIDRCDNHGGLCTADRACSPASCIPEHRCSISGNICPPAIVDTCNSGADGTCTEVPTKVCQRRVVDSVYAPGDADNPNGTLFIGPSVVPTNPDPCTTSATCPGSQICIGNDDQPCNGRPDCLCAHADQSRWKYTILHEAGHQLKARRAGDFQFETSYTFACRDPMPGEPAPVCRRRTSGGALIDPPSISELCGCEHVDASAAVHCLQSAELFAAAFNEGFAHFNAARLTNFRDNPLDGLPEQDCSFGYYKEVLGAIDCASLPLGSCSNTLFPTSLGDLPVRLPPVHVDCSTPLPWRNTFCPATLPGTDISTMSTEHDFLQFFWSIYSKGARVDIGDMFNVFLSACNREACPNGDPDMPCHLCALDGTPLVWSAGDSDLVYGLLEGATDYYDAAFGVGSPQFVNFTVRATEHGITPESLAAP